MILIVNFTFFSAIQLRNLLSNTRGVGARRILVRTVVNRLHVDGTMSRSAIKKPCLTEAHNRNRLQWAQKRRNWTPMQWRQYMFAD